MPSVSLVILLDVDEAIQVFISNLSKKIVLESIIIFGSTARGDRLMESDVDLIVVSDSFSNMPLNERFRIVYMAWPPQIDADIIPLTKRELESILKRSVILKDAQKYWRVIKVMDEQR